MIHPTLVHVLDITVNFDMDLQFPSVSGERAFLRASGGKIVGSGIEASVEPQAGDWLIRQPDGVLVNDQRFFFTTEAGDHIYMRAYGYTQADGSFQCTPRFDAQAGPMDWLTRWVFVGTGRLDSDGLSIRVYKLED